MRPWCCNFTCPLLAPSWKLPESVRGCRRESRRRQPSKESWASCKDKGPASFPLPGPRAGELALLRTPALWLPRALSHLTKERFFRSAQPCQLGLLAHAV